MNRYKRMAAAVIAGGGLTAGALAVTAGTAAADYGPSAAYQVEISANTAQGSFWIWAELDPSSGVPTSGSSGDYQETDCIHLGGGHFNTQGQALDAAAHDSGSVASWSVGDGTLTMTGVQIIGGLETATISIPTSTAPGGYGHTNGMTLTVTSSVLPDPASAGLPPVGASIPFPSQNQIAP